MGRRICTATSAPVSKENEELGKPEPQDRLGFDYHKGKVTVKEVDMAMVGELKEMTGQ